MPLLRLRWLPLLVICWICTALGVRAQEIPPAQLERFAQAAVAVEKLRLNTQADLRRTLGTEALPKLRCHRLQAWDSYGVAVQQRVEAFCQRARVLIEQQGLTVVEFNRIRQAQRQNPDLRSRIQQQMIQQLP